MTDAAAGLFVEIAEWALGAIQASIKDSFPIS